MLVMQCEETKEIMLQVRIYPSPLGDFILLCYVFMWKKWYIPKFTWDVENNMGGNPYVLWKKNILFFIFCMTEVYF